MKTPINFVRWAPGFYNAVVKLRRKAGSAGDYLESMLAESWLRALLTATVLVALFVGIELSAFAGDEGGRFLLLSLACESGKRSWVVAASLVSPKAVDGEGEPIEGTVDGAESGGEAWSSMASLSGLVGVGV